MLRLPISGLHSDTAKMTMLRDLRNLRDVRDRKSVTSIFKNSAVDKTAPSIFCHVSRHLYFIVKGNFLQFLLNSNSEYQNAKMPKCQNANWQIWHYD
jgi:hypothetical protein